MRKFPFYGQHDAMQCGISCLQMICKYHGKYYSQEKLSHYCFASNEGVSFLGVSEAASLLGFRTICGKLTLEQLDKVPLPCILHWNQKHFVVLYKISKKNEYKAKYHIADPAKGLITYNKTDFSDNWNSTLSSGEEKGIAMILQPNSSFYEKEKDDEKEKRSISFMLKYVLQYKRYFIQILLGLLLGSIFQLIFPFLTQAVVDIGINHKQINFIYLILVAQLMLVISRTTVDFVRRWILLHISMRINISLLSDFFIKLLRLPMFFFDTKLLGDLMQRINDHSRVENFLTTQTLTILFTFFNFIIFGIVLLSYNALIFMVFLTGSIIYSIWVAIFIKKRKKLDYLTFEKQAANNNKTYQFLTSIQEIKLQDCEQRQRWEWEDIQADLFNVKIKSLKLDQTREAGGILINETKNIVITILAAMSVINGNMTLGMMLAVQYIIGQLNAPVEQLMNFIHSFQDVKISLERISEIHEKQNEEDNLAKVTQLPANDSSIHLRNLNFKYDVHAVDEILDGINFTIPKGKVTAIVGTSGSGKTTLIKLMLGYYPVSEGNITIGTVPLSDYNIKWWRRQCGVVMQDGYIFSESIARNVAVDDGEIDTNRLLHAVRMANIEEFIESLPLKYNTIIGQDGIGLSQGQKQRILIARAIYKDPEYIFLDEATNALDANNERVIVENLNDFYYGKTVVIVAHRLSTVKNADQIVVINKGRIVEIGNHTTLIEKNGVYYNLVKNQLELGN